MKKINLVTTLLATVIAVATASAQTMSERQNSMAHHDQHMNNQHTATSPMHKEFMQDMENMHKPMMEGIRDPNPNAAFVKGMIPHHEGAIAMAKTVLKYSEDAEIRQLAENIIKDQEKEIIWMKEWLAKHQQ